MTTWVHRVSHSSTVMQYISDICLNLFIAASAIALLQFGVSFFAK